MNKIQTTFYAILLMVILSVAAFGQNATIGGTISDPNGAAIFGGERKKAG